MLTERELDKYWRQLALFLAGCLALGTMVYFGLTALANAQRDLADAQRRQAATACIEHWQSWVRGTWAPPTKEDAAWCAALAGVEMDEELAKKLLAAMWATAQDYHTMIEVEQARRDNEVRTMCEASCELEAASAGMNEVGRGP
jgi:hypothetical protein